MPLPTLLRPEQITETLRRHGRPKDTTVLGVTYGASITVNIAGARLIVPDDVLAMPRPPSGESKRRTLFSRPE